MSLTRKIAGHTFYYGSAQLVVMVSGIISMPILTRVLSQAEYGLLNIINITLLLVATVFSGGLRHSLARFYGEYREKGLLPASLGTYLVCVFTLGIIGSAAAALLFYGLAAADVIPSWTLPLALMVSPLVFVKLSFAGIGCIYRMREEVVKYNIFEIANKYVAMGLCIWLVLTAYPRLFQYFRGLVIGEAVVFVALCCVYFGRRPELRPRFSRSTASGMFRYGVPLMAGSLATQAFHMGDRYVIKLLLDAEQVGLYCVGSQLASYTCVAIVGGFGFAMVPVIMNAWGAGEKERAEATLGNLVRYYALAAFPIALGLIAVRLDLIRLIASAKYLPSAPVVPLVVGAALLGGFVTPLTIGLYFAKKTGVIALLCAAMAALNIGLNIVLIPLPGPCGGIVGAAIATFTSSALYMLIGHLLARKHYSIVIPWRNLLQYGAAAIAMYFCVIHVEPANWLARLFTRIGAGIVLYPAVVLVLDRRLRGYIADRFLRRRGT